MSKKLILLLVLGTSLSTTTITAQQESENSEKPTYKLLSAFAPDSLWYDTDGNLINAHGGGLLYQNKTYYWYGEKRGKSRSE
eukprot:gene61860-84599_t